MGFRGFFKKSQLFLEIVTTKKSRVDPTHFHKGVYRNSGKWIQKESTRRKSVYLPTILHCPLCEWLNMRLICEICAIKHQNKGENFWKKYRLAGVKKPGSEISPLGHLEHSCEGKQIFCVTSFYIWSVFQHGGEVTLRKFKVPVEECRNVSNVKKTKP